MENAPNIYEQQKRNRRATVLIITLFILFFCFLGYGFDLFYLGVDPFGIVGESGFAFPLATILALEKETKGDRRLANMLTVGKLIAAAALQRRESRGAHFRTDYPVQDDRLAKRSFLTLAKADGIAREAAESHGKPRQLHLVPGRAALHA